MNSRAMRRSRITVLAASVATGLALAGPATPAVPAPVPAPDALSGDVHSLLMPAGDDPSLQVLPARTTQPFSMIGLTWNDASVQLEGTAEVRTRDSRTGVWSQWRTLDADVRAPETGPEQPGGARRGGTSPLWTGPSDGVQLRAQGEALPEGLRVELIDPGRGTDVSVTPVDPGSASSSPAPETPPALAQAPAGAPSIISRAGWGADESLVEDPPRYNTTTKAIFVHHTAGTNNYTCAQSASIIRGIFRYHVQSQGWNDIGYHFLVDKCGKVFEGRAGGIDRPVQGAHTYGLNVDTSSISVLGDHMTAKAVPAVKKAIATVAAWKLGLYGHNPAGSVTLTVGADNGNFERGDRVRLKRISGHRDGSATDCPGDKLYADLPEVRTLAAAVAAGVALYGTTDEEGTPGAGPGPDPRPGPGWDAGLLSGLTDITTGDFDSDGFLDTVLTYRTAGGAMPLVLLHGTASGPDTASPAVLHGAGGQAVASGDLNGDGYDDLAVLTDHGIDTFHGSADGLTTTGAATLDGSGHAGSSFTARDTDADGYDELLVDEVVVAKGSPHGAAPAKT
ncbi:FG-GAP-like repeat-containing protein [Streptomyces sp. NPDC057445]|uniref:FG-GAP-like repeat-containing protein n=1 Tax=Streptomyces sp. NPDC057445 TaxID=3346136 RepID=UPI0036A30A26